MHSRGRSAWWGIDGARDASPTTNSNIMLRSRLVTIRIKPARLHVPGVCNIALAREGIGRQEPGRSNGL
jgi:hypothetical protein